MSSPPASGASFYTAAYTGVSFLSLLNSDDRLPSVDFPYSSFDFNGDDPADPTDFHEPAAIPRDIELMMDSAAGAVADPSDEDSSRLLTSIFARDLDEQPEEAVGGFEELEIYSQRDKVSGRKKRKNQPLEPSESDRMMGQASHLYASRDYEEAFKTVHQVIRSDPRHADAWKLLAVLHEESGNPTKALEANFIAAHLDSKDAGLWRRLADISLRNGNQTDGLYCLSKCISADSSDIDVWFTRSDLYKSIGLLNKAMSGYTTILELSPHNMRAIKELTAIFKTLHDAPRAIKLYEGAIGADETEPIFASNDQSDAEETEEDDWSEDEGSDSDEQTQSQTQRKATKSKGSRIWRVGYPELLCLLDLYIEANEYERGCAAVETVVARLETGFDLKKWQSGPIGLSFASIGNAISVDAFSNVPVSIHVKYGICKLWLEDLSTAKVHFDMLIATNDIEEYSDLFVHIVDAYMGKRMFAAALGILEILVKNEKMNVAVVWAKMADCFQNLGRFEDAVELYKSAIEVNPKEYDWQLQLAEIYEALGEPEKAKATINEVNELTRKDLSSEVLKQKPRRKPQASRPQEYTVPTHTDESEAPNDADDDDMDIDDDYSSLLKPVRRKNRAAVVRGDAVAEAATVDKAVMLASLRVAVSEHREWYARMTALEDKLDEPVKRADFVRYARKLVIRFQNERAFYPADRVSFPECDKFEAFSRQRFFFHALDLVLQKRSKKGLTYATWFEIFVKYAMALTIDKKDEDAYLALKTAHDANVFYHNETLNTQLRLYMLEYFLDAHRLAPDDPLVNLSLGISFLHWSMIRSVDNRHRRVLQAFTFLHKYEELRGSSPEALYNIGRAYHQLGLDHMAISYYEKVLACVEGDDVDGAKMRSKWPVKEAAYNMSLILNANGSSAYAQAILAQHLTF
ncbi:transcription factor TFIIIC subunit tfc4 [Entophlyctis sp. JEL0112]|nr:transcription factor TFIIIC subunit tfc4 [Entophlyctis sp. JEL0112]